MLVDTGADYSNLSRKIETQLEKVIAPWNNSRIRTAGGHIVTPLGACMIRVQIRGCTFLANGLILRECSRDIILGVDFLQEYGAVIDLQERHVTVSARGAINFGDDQQRANVLCVAAARVTLSL